jgi:hypothetical protein
MGEHRYWVGMLKTARLHPTVALRGQTISDGIDVALCARVLLGCCRTQHDSPADTRRRLAADLAAGHVGERMYRHATEVLDALEHAWRTGAGFIEAHANDWIAIMDGSGGHMRRNHHDPENRGTR